MHELRKVEPPFLLARAIPDGLLSGIAGLGLYIAWVAIGPRVTGAAAQGQSGDLVQVPLVPQEKEKIVQGREYYDIIGAIEKYKTDLLKNKKFESACRENTLFERGINQLLDTSEEWRTITGQGCILAIERAFGRDIT